MIPLSQRDIVYSIFVVFIRESVKRELLNIGVVIYAVITIRHLVLVTLGPKNLLLLNKVNVLNLDMGVEFCTVGMFIIGT